MIVKTSFGEYKVGRIYQHYKGDFYKIESVSKLHDSQNVFLINYCKCTKEGIYISIRENVGEPNEVIIHQPFATHETRWQDVVGKTPPTLENPEGEEIKRFTLIN